MVLLRVLELLGVRYLYRMTGGGISGQLLPTATDAPTTPGWSHADLEDLLEGARYFGIANFVRLILHIPVLVFLSWQQAWGFVTVFSVVVAFHLLCVVLEVYKFGVARRLVADESAVAQSEHSVLTVGEALPWGNWFWRNRKWETERFYRALGMDWFQEIVTTYIDLTRLNRRERKSGEKVEYLGKMSPSDLARFEAGTRLGEFAHWIFAALDLGPVVVCALHFKQQWPWMFYLGFLLWGDSSLALLQRFHRLRITGLLERYRAREQRKVQKKTERTGAASLR